MQYVQQKRTHLNFHQSLSLKEFFDKREICLIPSSVNKIFLFQTQTSKTIQINFHSGHSYLWRSSVKVFLKMPHYRTKFVSGLDHWPHMRLMICLPNMMSHLARGLVNCPDSYCQVAAWSLRECEKITDQIDRISIPKLWTMILTNLPCIPVFHLPIFLSFILKHLCNTTQTGAINTNPDTLTKLTYPA